MKTFPEAAAPHDADGSLPAVSFHTLGCKTNQLETSALADQFRARGWRITPFDEPADVAVINTCTVTERADADSRRAIRRARLANPKARVVVTGCYAQVAAEAVSRLPGVDYVIGNNDKHHLLTILDTLPRSDTPVVRVGEIDKSRIMAGATACDVDRTRASLKIQDGCDYKCTYCIIWQARGPSRSLPADDIVAHIRTLEAQGYREIVLTGINIGQYADPHTGTDLAGLLARLIDDPTPAEAPLARLRLTSLDPLEVSPALMAVMARSAGRVCPHLHLSTQSLCDPVLKAMARRHHTHDVMRVCQTLQDTLPDAGLGADFIVGFPGETEAMFEETLAQAAALPWTYAHVFRYSPRAATPASQASQPVPEAVKIERANRLKALIDAKQARFQQRFVGRSLPTLIEASGRTGLSDNYLRLTLAASQPAQTPNMLMPLRIVGLHADTLWAEPLAP